MESISGRMESISERIATWSYSCHHCHSYLGFLQHLFQRQQLANHSLDFCLLTGDPPWSSYRYVHHLLLQLQHESFVSTTDSNVGFFWRVRTWADGHSKPTESCDFNFRSYSSLSIRQSQSQSPASWGVVRINAGAARGSGLSNAIHQNVKE